MGTPWELGAELVHCLMALPLADGGWERCLPCQVLCASGWGGDELPKPPSPPLPCAPDVLGNPFSLGLSFPICHEAWLCPAALPPVQAS